MIKSYIKLTAGQISLLESRGCTADDWGDVEVDKEFNAQFVRNVRFSGLVRIGALSGSGVSVHGVSKRTGLYNASIYNSTLGDDVYISNVGSHIANYDIGHRVVIENVGTISCEGESTFGNGVEVASINEAGGREVPIYDHLTAQIAYIIAMYRHRPATIEKIRAMIAAYARTVKSDRGSIGTGTVITDSISIINVKIGEYASLSSVSALREGTVNSTKESPSRVGVEVIATNFIIARSSTVDTGCMFRNCFMGEGTLFENGFSAENSLFFANCHCNHGEACAVFAGPYTVTHHRSTLLIAGYFSFFNAGSGANQSNHMYKSGPVHQGVHLRGCKFGSDAYILLPACTGAFSIVTGRHYSHYDTSEMPFSYILDEEEQTFLIPGINLRSYGTARDVIKWPKRDKRVGVASDIINFDMMTPYIGGKILRAIQISQMLLAKYPTLDVVTWNRAKIKQTSLKKGLSFYRQSLYSYLGELFSTGGAAVLGKYMPAGDMEKWVDMAGMIAPKLLVEQLLDRIDNKEINDLPQIEKALREIEAHYKTYVNYWAVYAVSVLLGKSVDRITEQDIAAVIKQGETETKAIKRAIDVDAGRDAAPLMSIGYGIDSDDDADIASDFARVRDL